MADTPYPTTDRLPDKLDSNGRVAILNNGTLVGTRRTVNLIPGTNTTITATDDGVNELVAVTLGATSSSPTGAAGGDLTGTYPNPTIATGAITSAKILDGTITGTDIASGTVTTGNILDGTILNGDIADGTITNAKLATPGGTYTLLSWSSSTAAQTGISSITDLTSLTATVTVPAGGTIIIRGTVNVQQRTSVGDATLSIREGATLLNRGLQAGIPINGLQSLAATVLLTPSTGSHTYKLSLATSASTIDTISTATNPAFIIVELVA